MTIESGRVSRKLEPTVDGGVLEVSLSEADTLALPPGSARMQVKALVGGEVTALPEPTTEPQSPVTLPVLPAPTFNVYHDGDVPSDTATTYARDINLVLANLEAVQTALLGGE